MNIGMLIAGGIVAIYVLVGPLIFFGLYVFFDRLAQGRERSGSQQLQSRHKDPALWSTPEVKKFLKHDRGI